MRFLARFLVFFLAFFLGAQGFSMLHHIIQKPGHLSKAHRTYMSKLDDFKYQSLSIETILDNETSSTHIISTPQNEPTDMIDFWEHMQKDCHDGCKQSLECACSIESLDIKISEDFKYMTIKATYPEGKQTSICNTILKWMQHRYTAYSKQAPSTTTGSEFCCH